MSHVHGDALRHVACEQMIVEDQHISGASPKEKDLEMQRARQPLKEEIVFSANEDFGYGEKAFSAFKDPLNV